MSKRYNTDEDRKRAYYESQKKWKAKNKDKVREYQKRYKASHQRKCKESRKKYDKIYRLAHAEKHKTYAVERHLITTYGITVEQYNGMFLLQDGRCAICGIHQKELKKALYVDHDHKTGKVRGLLCPNCNAALGMLRESKDIIASLLDYIQRGDV